MAQISEYHQYLFLGKITNSLSTEEERELNELFARDETAMRIYDTLIARLPAGHVAGSFRYLDAPGFWKDISGELHEQQALRYQRKARNVSTIGGLVVLLAVCGWWLFPGQPRDTHAIASYRVPVNSVELKLADGSTIDLSKTPGRLKKDRLVLDNHDNALSYEAAGSDATGLNSLTVPATMDYKLKLSDGSEIWLNSASTVSFPSRFAAGEREISISGEAWCRIAKHAGQPFILHLPGSTVEVTGTEFNVNTYDPAVVKVALVSGGANLLSGTSKIKLDPGYQGISVKGRLTQAPFDAQRVLSWRDGVYYFDRANLVQLSQVLGRWFGIKTQLDDPALADKEFAGALYKHRSLGSFLDNLKAISHIDSHFDDKGVLHFTAGQ